MYSPQKTTDRIKQIARTNNVSITKMQEECGLNRNIISQSAKSQDGMKAKNLFAIANYLDVSVDYLLGRTDDPKANNYNNISNGNGTQAVGENIAIQAIAPQSIDNEILSLLQDLSLVQKAEIILKINEMKNSKKR